MKTEKSIFKSVLDHRFWVKKKLIVDCPFWLNIHKVVHIHIQEKTECCVHYGNPVNVYRSGNVNEEMG